MDEVSHECQPFQGANESSMFGLSYELAGSQVLDQLREPVRFRVEHLATEVCEPVGSALP
jgi:hypothetical protein